MTSPSDTRTYTLHLAGAPDADFLASFCPRGARLAGCDGRVILSNLRTDQAGVIGLIRRLHNLGCTLLALSTEPGEDQDE